MTGKKNIDKKTKILFAVAQAVIYFSMLTFSASNVFEFTLPDAIVLILGVLDILTIPTILYCYVKMTDGDNE